MALEDNKLIRIILEATDKASPKFIAASRRIEKELDDLDKSFVKSRKNVNLYEEDVEDLGDVWDRSSKKGDSFSGTVHRMSDALRLARKEAIQTKRELNRTFAGFGKTTTKQDKSGRFVKVSESFSENFTKGFRAAESTNKELDKMLQRTKEIRRENLFELKAKHKENRANLKLAQDEERAARLTEIHRKQDPLRAERIETVRLIAEARKKEDLEEEARLVDLHEKQTDLINDVARRESAIITKKYQILRFEEEKLFDIRLAAIKNPDIEAALKKFAEEREKILTGGTRFDRTTKRAGFALGDFFSGAKRGRSNVQDLDKDLGRLSTTFGKVGFAIGSAFRDLNNFVNLRWLLLTSFVTVLINLLAQLVVVLVAVASSAILATIALGSALISGLAQAVPVIGLLAGAFSELKKAMEAVKLADKVNSESEKEKRETANKRRQALQRLSDAHYSVKKAVEAVGDAEYELSRSNKRVTETFKDRIDAIKDLAKTRKQAAQDIVDANLQEKDSALALEEAELGVLQAKEKLRKEEERARKSKGDVQGAQAAIREARDRLNLAQAQGDNAEIIKASQQLAIAQQNLNAIQDQIESSKNDLKDAQLGVQRSEINRKQAVSRKRKDAQEAKELRKNGVSQSDIVVRAEERLANATQSIADAQRDVIQSQRRLSDSIHSVNIARREENDARLALKDSTNLQSTAQKNLNDAIANFSPAQKKLFESLVKLSDVYKKTFVGGKGKDAILAPILEGFTTIADAITKLLKDPQILKALNSLSQSIGDSLNKIGKSIASESFKDDILFFIEQATESLPKIVDIFTNILSIIRNIARASAPIFSNLLDGLKSITGRADKFTSKQGEVTQRPVGERGAVVPVRDPSPLEKSLSKASDHLKVWLDLGKAITRVISVLVTNSAPTGQSLIETFTNTLNRFSDFIEENPEKVQKFFKDVSDNFKEFVSVLLDLTKAFGKLAKDDQIQAFAIFVIEVIVPGIILMIKVIGYLAQGLDALTKIPLLGKFIKFATQVFIAEKALNKLFPVSQGITKLFRKGLNKALSGFFSIIKDPRSAIAAFKVQLQLMGAAAGNSAKKIKVIGENWKGVGRSVVDAGKKFKNLAKAQGILAALRTATLLLGTSIYVALGPIGLIILAIAAIGAAVYLLDRKFHFLRPTVEFIWRLFKSVFNWIKDHWRLVTVLLTGPIGAAVFLIIKHWKEVKDLFFRFKDFLSDNFFKPVYDTLIKPFVSASEFIIGLFSKLPELIGDLIKKIPGLSKLFSLGGKTIGFFEKAAGAAKKAAIGVGGAADRAEKYLSPTNKISPTRVINNNVKDRNIIARLKKQGLTDEEILRWLISHGAISKANFRKRFGFKLSDVEGFMHGGEAGVGKTDTVPAMLTPGEWIVNAKQQRKLASALGTSVTQAKAIIFGTNVGATIPKGLKPSKKENTYFGKTFTLIPQEDASGVSVWFIKMADGTFGQVTGRDATKIQSSQGRYIPNYVKRNAGGFKQMLQFPEGFIGGPSFAMGGVVPRAVQNFAEGGVVQSPGFGNTTANQGTQVNQNFNVKTEGATDWSYVMRLSAITAQSAF